MATDAELLSPFDLDAGPDGRLHILDTLADTIVRVDDHGRLEVIAGNGDRGQSGDGGQARAASFLQPQRLRSGPDGSIYVLDIFSGRGAIRRVSPSGVIETVVKFGKPGTFGIGETLEEQGLHGIGSFDVGPDGVLYLASNTQHRVYRVTPRGAITVIAGAGDPIPDVGEYSGDGGPATAAELDRPDAIAVASDGTIYFADGRTSNERIRRIRPDGVIETYMTAAGGQNSAGALRTEVGYVRRSNLQLDAEGRMYWIDSDREGSAIKRIGLDNRIEVLWRPGSHRLLQQFLVADSAIYVIADSQVLRVGGQAGQAEVVAGVGIPDASHGSGGEALEAALMSPAAIAVGSDGRIYVGELSRQTVRLIRNGAIEEFAGNGSAGPLTPPGGPAGEGGPARDASFRDIRDLAVGPDGSVLIADGAYVRRVRPDGVIDRYAGDGLACPSAGLGNNCGDGGPATEAQLGPVREIAMDRFGNGFILANEHRGRGDWIRRVGVDGTIHTLGGELETAARDGGINTIAIRSGESLLAYTVDNGIWSIDQAGSAAPLPTLGHSLSQVWGPMAASPSGEVYVWNSFFGLLQQRPDGSSDLLLPGVSNASTSLDLGDGGRPRDATTGSLGDIAIDSEGNLYLADQANRVIRRINAPHECPQVERPQIAAVTNASFFPGGFGPGSIVTVFGSGLGPAVGAVAAPGPDSRFATELSGVKVIIDGVEATILYVSDTQINAIVPFGVEVIGRYRRSGANPPVFSSIGAYNELRVVRDGVDSDPQRIAMEPASPAFLLLANDQAAAINQDGSVNGEANPAGPGSVVALYMSGGGVMEPAIEDGAVVGSTLPLVQEKVVVEIGGQKVQALYAGGAPGLVAGVMQVNFTVPLNLVQAGRLQVRVKVGLQTSQKAAYLWVR